MVLVMVMLIIIDSFRVCMVLCMCWLLVSECSGLLVFISMV